MIYLNILRRSKLPKAEKMGRKGVSSKPIKMWIDGKIYHIKRLENKPKRNMKTEDLLGKSNQDRDHFALLDINEVNGKYQTSFRLPKPYYTKIQKLPDFSLDELCKYTNSSITLPNLRQDDDSLKIESNNADNLMRAASHIHSAIGKVREQSRALQFVCIPLLNESVQAQFENLKKEILTMSEEVEGLHESVFISPLKLHITIDVFVLLDYREQHQAIKALKDYQVKLDQLLEKTGPIELEIRGLRCMNRNLKNVDVLYAYVKLVNETEDHNLQKICNDISEHFYNRGLTTRPQENVKIHMTVINTKYRKEPKCSKKSRRKQSIDATKIIEKFKEYSFGVCNLESLHLSHISSRGEDGFYKPLYVINLSKPNKNN